MPKMPNSKCNKKMQNMKNKKNRLINAKICQNKKMQKKEKTYKKGNISGFSCKTCELI